MSDSLIIWFSAVLAGGLRYIAPSLPAPNMEHEMRVTLFPQHSLPSFITPASSTGDAALYAAILYADTITLSELRPPDSIRGLPSASDLREELEYLLPPKARASPVDPMSERYTWRQAAVLLYASYHDQQAIFRKTWRPLLHEEIIEVWDLGRVAPAMQRLAEQKGDPLAPIVGLEGILSVFAENLPTIASWLLDSERTKHATASLNRYDGLGVASIYLRGLLDRFEKPTSIFCQKMDKTDRESKELLFVTAYFLGSFLQAFSSAAVDAHVLGFSPEDLRIRPELLLFFGYEDKADSRSALELKIIKETTVEIPAIIPRSPEAIVEIRHSLREELEAFRATVTRIAEDIDLEDSSKVSSKIIKKEVRQLFRRPLEDLERRLKYPSRELMRSILGKEAFLTGALSLTTAFSAGMDAFSSFLASVSVPTLMAALQARFQRKRELEKAPEIAFLLQASSRGP